MARAPVYAVDLWTVGTSKKGRGFRRLQQGEAQGSSKFHTQAVLDVFTQRMARYSQGLVEQRMGASVEVAATFRPRTIGLLFIDAEHTYEACRADFEAWSPLMTEGGIIALHDYKRAGNGGVQRFIDEMLAVSSRWQQGEIVGSMVVLRAR